MKQKKHVPESLPEIPPKPERDVPKTDRERAENEGMTVKPNRDPANLDGLQADKEKATPAAAPTPKTEGVEGEGSYTASRRYREGLERSVKKGDSDKLAEEAKKALEGPEGDALRAAEQSAKQGKTPRARPQPHR